MRAPDDQPRHRASLSKPPRPIILSRKLVYRMATLIAIVVLSLGSYAAIAVHRMVEAERAAAAAAHNSSVRFVRLGMELQAELDEQEVHDRNTLQLYLALEREHLPQLQRALTSAADMCSNEVAAKAAHAALSDFGEQAHAHSQQMLDALHHQAARAHRRAQELAQHVLSQARTDRERVRLSGGKDWSDADLEGPLLALYRRLRRPNATFELSLQTLSLWEAGYVDAVKDGGAGSSRALQQRLVLLAQEAPLPRNDADRVKMMRATYDELTNAFVALLQRARLHRHLPQLLEALEGFEKHEKSVWDAVDLIEQLRAQHVFPMTMLRLAEHEWDSLVGGAADAVGRDPHHFDADQ